MMNRRSSTQQLSQKYQYRPVASNEQNSSSSDDESWGKRLIPIEPASARNLCNTALILSLLLNAALAFVIFAGWGSDNEILERSPFAGLTRSIPRQWDGNTPGNDTEWEALWDEHTNYDAGVISLDDEYAKSMGLPRAQRWPWDESRGIYLVQAYHSIHCTKNLRKSLEEFKYSRPQSIPWPHVQHCLLVLRDEIMCNADDIPRYSGFQPEHSSGLGQYRMCRDWDALEAWAKDKERSGCWRDIPGEENVDGFQVLDKYRFCPDDSKYAEDAKHKWRSQTLDEVDGSK